MASDSIDRPKSVRQVREVELPVGIHIDSAATLMVGRANEVGEPVTARFNGVRLSAKPGVAPVEIAAAYRARMAADAKVWRESPEGKARAAQRTADIAASQAIADRLAVALQSLDFADHEAVIRLLYELQGPSDDVDVKVDSEAFIEAFAAQGLTPNMCTGPEYRDDPDTTYRYLVGQALDGLSKLGAIHPMFRHFADKWLAETSSQALGGEHG